MKKLAVLGASGHGKVIAEIAELNGWDDVVFFDDAWPDKKRNAHWWVAGNSQDLSVALEQYEGVIVAIGNNDIRAQKLSLLKQHGAPLVALIHPSAVVSPRVSIGVGVVVMAGAIVNVDTTLGDGVIINTASSVDHDCCLDDCVHISPGAHLAGGVSVGARSWVGIGASVRQLVTIGMDVMVGAGAAVVSDLPERVTALGVPAKF